MVLSERYGFAYYPEWGLVLGGWQRGGPEGIALIRRGIENLRRQLSLARMPYWLSLLADAQARSGAVAEAVATLDAAHTSASSRGDLWWLPEITRMRAAQAVGGHRAELLDAALALACNRVRSCRGRGERAATPARPGRVSSRTRPATVPIPSTDAIFAATCVGSVTGASSTSHTPSPSPSSDSAATCTASRVLPVPPVPTSVSNRPPPTSACTSRSSARCPTKLVA